MGTDEADAGQGAPNGDLPPFGAAVYVILGIIHLARDDFRKGNPCLP
jgi:hypothetical protein